MNSYKERLEEELFSLSDKMQKLTQFTYTEAYNNLGHIAQILLDKQLEIMNDYAKILNDRLDLTKDNK